MARFSPRKPLTTAPDAVNLAGGQAHAMSPKLEFTSAVLTCWTTDTFYKTGDADVNRIATLAQSIGDPLFAAKAAVFTRRDNGLRSVSHLVAGELATRVDVKGAPWLRKFFSKVIVRPDDITETLAYIKTHGNPKLRGLSNALKRGFAEALGRFDAYQLGKYLRTDRDPNLIDAVNLLHPKSTPALQALMTGVLKAPDTWEVGMTAVGKAAKAAGATEAQKEEMKAQVWLDLLQAKKLGYLACLRNLRNIAEQSPEALKLALEFLTNENAVKSSKVFPFQFFTAAEALQGSKGATNEVRKALNTAMELSLSNVLEFEGKTLIALDNSGSMQGRPSLIAALFAAVIFKSQKDAEVMVFSEDAVMVNANPGDSLQTLANVFKGANRPCGTNFHSIFTRARHGYSRVIILSDMQAWIGHHTPAQSFKEFKSRTSCNPSVISFNLNSQDGTMQFPESKVCALAGFSDTVLGLMAKLEKDPQALVHEIEAVEL